jgi:hypothetical protein
VIGGVNGRAFMDDDLGSGGFGPIRGRSSAGRAPALQAGGHRFDPDRLHHGPTMGVDPAVGCIAVVRVRYGDAPGAVVPWCVGCAGSPSLCGAALFFVRVNQVLVRFWARVPDR